MSAIIWMWISETAIVDENLGASHWALACRQGIQPAEEINSDFAPAMKRR